MPALICDWPPSRFLFHEQQARFEAAQ